MKNSKIFKIIIAILVAVILFIIFTQNSFASIVGNIDTKFQGTGDKSTATNDIAGIFGKSINVLQVFGAGFAIIMLIVIGIRWISASPSGKAEIAKTSRYYILGAILIFAAVGLLQIVKKFANGASEQV